MDIIKINANASIKNIPDFIMQKFLAVFERADTFIYPTDTIYSLGANALNEDAVKRVFDIKRRPKDKALPVIVNNLEMAKKIAYIDKKHTKILNEIWPGAVTAVFRKRPTVPKILTGGGETIGIRIPNSSFAGELIDIVNTPITSTSASLLGKEPSHSAQKIINNFNNAFPSPSLFFDADEILQEKSSTVIDLTGDEPKILRIGPISKKDLNF